MRLSPELGGFSFRAPGFFINSTEAAKGTGAFKRASGKEKKIAPAVLFQLTDDVATAHHCSPELWAAPAHSPLRQEESLAVTQRNQLYFLG